MSFGQSIHDESYKDYSFWKFKVELEKSILDGDVEKFKTFLADSIYESCIDCFYCSKEKFVSFTLNEESYAETFKNMLKIIRFGFRKIQNSDSIDLDNSNIFQAPAYFTSFDSEKEVWVLAENVNLQAEPSLNAEIIRQASFEKFDCNCSVSGYEESVYNETDEVNWLTIKLKNGLNAYVSIDLTSRSIAREMTVSKINGTWKITSYYLVDC